MLSPFMVTVIVTVLLGLVLREYGIYFSVTITLINSESIVHIHVK